MPIQLDWQITQAPDDQPEPDWPPPAQKPPAPRVRYSRRIWLLLLALLFLLSAATLLTLQWASRRGWEQVSEQTAALVKLEEVFALTGDLEPLLALQDPADQGWREVRATLTRRHQPAPTPLLDLTPVGDHLIIRSITALNADVVIADVEREYTAPDGSTLSFHGPQFYRRSDESGRVRIAPPTDFWGQPTSWKSEYLHVLYFPPDKAAVADLAPLLDAKIRGACLGLELDCDPILPVSLWLSHDPQLTVPIQWAERIVTLNVVQKNPGTVIIAEDETFLALASFQYGLLPADDAARDALATRLTAYTARFLAQKLYGDTPLMQEIFRRILFLESGIPESQ